MQGNLFQKCTHILYCSVLSLGGNVNTGRMSKPEMGSIFHIKNQWNILVITLLEISTYIMSKTIKRFKRFEKSMLLKYWRTGLEAHINPTSLFFVLKMCWVHYISSTIGGNRGMDQLYATSQVSNITRKTKFSYNSWHFSRFNKKV